MPALADKLDRLAYNTFYNFKPYKLTQIHSETHSEFFMKFQIKRVSFFFCFCLVLSFFAIVNFGVIDTVPIGMNVGQIIPILYPVLFLAGLLLLIMCIIVVRFFLYISRPVFHLVLENDIMFINGNKASIPEAIKIKYRTGARHEQLYTRFSTSKLLVEPFDSRDFAPINKISRSMAYEEKRILAETLVRYLKVPFIDEVASSGTQISTKEQEYEKLIMGMDIGNSKPPQKFKAKLGRDELVLEFPLISTRVILLYLSLFLLYLFAFSYLNSSFFTQPNHGGFGIVESWLLALLVNFTDLFVFSIVIFLPRSRTTIVVTGDFFMIKQRYFWGTREKFRTKVDELRDFYIFSKGDSATLMFQSDLSYLLSDVYSEHQLVELVNYINMLLLIELPKQEKRS